MLDILYGGRCAVEGIYTGCAGSGTALSVPEVSSDTLNLLSKTATYTGSACVKTGIVSGSNENTISPKDYVTRAEVAAMAERLLQKSNLI